MVELILKQNVRNNRLHIAICDENLIGRKLNEGNKSLNLDVDFYNGDKCSKEDIKIILDKCVSASFVGEESLKLGKQVFGDIDIKKIEGVPFTNVFRL